MIYKCEDCETMFGDEFKYCSECGGRCKELDKKEYLTVVGPDYDDKKE